MSIIGHWRSTENICEQWVGGEGGIRTHGTLTRTTVFETVVQAQIGTGGRVNSRWLQAPATSVICTPVPLRSEGNDVAFLCIGPRN